MIWTSLIAQGKRRLWMSLFVAILVGLIYIHFTRFYQGRVSGWILAAFGVPVVLIAGDLAVTIQAKEILGNIAVVSVKEGIGKAAKMIHPEKARKMIRAATVEALRDRARYRPYKPTSPITMEVMYTKEELAAKAALYPGTRRTGDRSVAFTHDDLMEVLKFYVTVTG